MIFKTNSEDHRVPTTDAVNVAHKEGESSHWGTAGRGDSSFILTMSMLTLCFLQSMENTFEVIEHLANNAKEKLSEKQTLAFQLRKETEEQKPKLQRVTKQVPTAS